MRRPSQHAFSLIELVAVTGIVALLIAVALPSFREAVRQARVATCAGNLRQIGVAWKLYTNEHEDEFPSDLNAHAYFREYLDPYTKDENVFHCPADNIRFPVYQSPPKKNSYIMNNVLMGIRTRRRFDGFDELDAEVRRQRVIRVTVSESQLAFGGDVNWLWGITKPRSGTYAYQEDESFHHVPQTNNILFYDGHVDFVRTHNGVFISREYTLNPFQELYALALKRGLVGPKPDISGLTATRP